MLNSLATTTAIWKPLLPQLTEFHSVVCVDYPGHGHSPSKNLPKDFDALAAQILSVLDVMEMGEAHLVGASIGGMLAIALAAENPERIRSLAVVGSSPHMDVKMWADRTALVSDFGVAGVVPDVLPRWFTDEFTREQPAIVEAYRDMLCRTTDTAYQAFCEILEGLDVRPRLAHISCPTLVVSGEEDTATPVEEAKEILDLVPGARLEILPGAAHMIQAMRPAALGRILKDHIQAVS